MHFFWDFDGTLYDSYPQMANAMERALAGFGASEPRVELNRLLKVSVYHGCCVLAERHALPLAELQTAFAREHAKERALPLYPGARECLQALHALGCKHYLYTHRGHTALDALERDGLAPLFADAITRDDGFPDKPAPDALLFLLRKHAIPAHRALMAGDRAIDLQSAVNAGIATALFDPGGYYPDTPALFRAGDFGTLTESLVAWAKQ